MNFSFYIAKRYLHTSSKNNAINTITKIASFGIVIGAMALFVVLSVFSGLKDFSLSFSNSFDPDLKIIPKTGKYLFLDQPQIQQIQQIQQVKFYSKIIEEKALFLFNKKEQVAYIKGVDNQYCQVNKVQKNLFQGQWLSPQSPQVVIGYGIAQKLSMGLYDLNTPLEVYMPRPGKGAITNPEAAFNQSVLIPVGIYSVNEELDNKYIFTDLTLAQELLEYKPNQITGLEIKLDTLTDPEPTIVQLQNIFKNQVQIKTRTQLNDSLHKMLNTENLAIYLIFTLVIIMTLFTLAGAIIMIIIDKKSNLKTLFNLGVTVPTLRHIFLLQGTLLTLVGGVLGILLGIAIVLVQQYYKIIKITPSLAYPVKFTVQNTFVVFFTIAILGIIASYIASSRVQKKMLE